jgi:prolipoprotein diacylglyceryl transferase
MEFESQFIQIGSIQIRYYGIIIVTAMITATFVALNLAKRTGRDPEHVYGALTWAIIPGIIFARLWFVMFPPVVSTNTLVQEEFTYTVPAQELVTEEGQLATEFNLGLEFVSLAEDSALVEAGLETDDRIIQVQAPGDENPTAVFDQSSLTSRLASIEDRGADVTLVVERGVPKDRNWYLANFFDLDGGGIAIWSGGLSIFGALLGGLGGAYLYLRRNGLPIGPWVDIAAIVVPLGQAIGRWANYVNQELFGDLTTLPWAVNIPYETGEAALKAAESIAPSDPLPFSLLEYTVSLGGGNLGLSFHPLFLYESLWSIAAFFVLLWVFNNYRDRFRPGDFLLIFIIQYSVIRFLLEFIRLEVTLVGDLNLSQVVTAAAFVVAAVLLFVRLSGRKSDPRPYDEIAPPVWPEEAPKDKKAGASA